MAPTLRRAGGGLLATLGLLTSLAAVVALRQLLPLPERTDVPGGFAFLFALLLFLAGLGLLAAGIALLGGGADWVGGRARSVFRAAGYLVAGCLPVAVVAVVAVALTGRIEAGVLVVVGGGLLGVLAVALGLAVGLASVAYRAVAG